MDKLSEKLESVLKLIEEFNVGTELAQQNKFELSNTDLLNMLSSLGYASKIILNSLIMISKHLEEN